LISIVTFATLKPKDQQVELTHRIGCLLKSWVVTSTNLEKSKALYGCCPFWLFGSADPEGHSAPGSPLNA
jgi:hypothetical protein